MNKKTAVPNMQWLAYSAAVLLTLWLGTCHPVNAATLVDGEYDCGGGYTYRAMGKVDIRGNQFRYRPFGDVVRPFASYSVDPNGAIRWGGAFGGLDDPPARIVDLKVESWGFNVRYQGNPSGLINTMSCHAPGK